MLRKYPQKSIRNMQTETSYPVTEDLTSVVEGRNFLVGFKNFIEASNVGFNAAGRKNTDLRRKRRNWGQNVLSIDYFIRYYFPFEVLNWVSRGLNRRGVKAELAKIDEFQEFHHTEIINSDRMMRIVLNLINMNSLEKVLRTGLLPKVRKVLQILTSDEKYGGRTQKNYIVIFQVNDPLFILQDDVTRLSESDKTNFIIYLFMRKFLKIGTNYSKPLLLRDTQTDALFGHDFACQKMLDLMPVDWIPYHNAALTKIEAAIESKSIQIIPIERFRAMREEFARDLNNFKKEQPPSLLRQTMDEMVRVHVGGGGDPPPNDDLASS